MGGKACIAGTQITVRMILLQLSEGVTHMELLSEYPHLTKEDISEAIKYAAWAVGTRELSRFFVSTFNTWQFKSNNPYNVNAKRNNL